MSTNPHPGVAPVEMLLEWEGPAINDPATAGSKEPADFMDETVTLASAAIWVTITIGQAVLGSSVYETLKARLISYLAGRRSQQGQKKLDELKQQVLEEIGKQFPDPKQAETLRQAVEQVFERAEE
jgi:hypothetical protein